MRFLLTFYKRFVSPYLPMACRFYPSCSDYAHEAFVKHTFMNALWLTLKRLSQCQPFGRHGIDFVPDCKSILKNYKGQKDGK